ncbi:MAG TPA: deaminase [Gammaproteobacteria bacterium]|nr:deaminase [Gammaproteobacteria bacterium]
MNQDRYFLSLAYEFAKNNSSDPRTQNGAVIVDSSTCEVLSYGANRFPQGVQPLPERLEPDVKRDYLEHAERDAIFSALRQGKNTTGAILYCPWFACSDCAKAIIGAGIRSVIGHVAPCKTETTWTASIAVGLVMFQEAEVEYRYFDGVVGVKELLFRGEKIDR